MNSRSPSNLKAKLICLFEVKHNFWLMFKNNYFWKFKFITLVYHIYLFFSFARWPKRGSVCHILALSVVYIAWVTKGDFPWQAREIIHVASHCKWRTEIALNLFTKNPAWFILRWFTLKYYFSNDKNLWPIVFRPFFIIVCRVWEVIVFQRNDLQIQRREKNPSMKNRS